MLKSTPESDIVFSENLCYSPCNGCNVDRSFISRIIVQNHCTHLGLKWGLFLKISKQKLAEGLDQLISSRHAKFRCPKLLRLWGDSGENLTRTNNIQHRQFYIILVVTRSILNGKPILHISTVILNFPSKPEVDFENQYFSHVHAFYSDHMPFEFWKSVP